MHTSRRRPNSNSTRESTWRSGSGSSDVSSSRRSVEKGPLAGRPADGRCSVPATDRGDLDLRRRAELRYGGLELLPAIAQITSDCHVPPETWSEPSAERPGCGRQTHARAGFKTGGDCPPLRAGFETSSRLSRLSSDEQRRSER